jgi:hypothetical protein
MTQGIRGPWLFDHPSACISISVSREVGRLTLDQLGSFDRVRGLGDDTFLDRFRPILWIAAAWQASKA